MTDLDVILEKLTTIENTQSMQSVDIKDLTKGFNILAVQSEQISNLQAQSITLWKRLDRISAPGGDIDHIKQFQSACPVASIEDKISRLAKDAKTSQNNIKEVLQRQWVVIGILATALISKGIWKIVA